MRAAVTGARGRVGRTLTSALVEEGHDVVGIDVSPGEDGPSLRSVTSGVEDVAALSDSLAGVDVVVHLAAVMTWSSADVDVERMMRTNVLGTIAVLRAAAASGVRRVVFASSGEVYPELSPQFQPVDETHPTEPRSPYGLSKLMGEDAVAWARRALGLEAVVLRFSHTQDAAELLDPLSEFSGPRFFLRSAIAQARKSGDADTLAVLEPLDDGTEQLLLARNPDGSAQTLCICDTRDLAAGIVLAVEKPSIDGAVIAVGPDAATSMADLVPAMAEGAGLPYVEASLPGGAINYSTKNERAREQLGFVSQWPMTRMLEDALQAREERATSPA